MDHRTVESFYAVVAPGLAEVCAQELAGLKMESIALESGGVAFRGRLRELYAANLKLRSASRVLVRFADFRCRDFPDLFKRAQRLPWGRFLRPDVPVQFRVTTRASRLIHSDRIAETLNSAVDQSLGRMVSPALGTPQLILVRVVGDQVVLSIDSSGELLHRRGYRQAVTVAPLRETLAAGVLQLLGWEGQEPLVDPMCGSGSFLSEGALIAARRAPGLERQFAFMGWPGFRQGLWQLLCDEARREQVVPFGDISGADENAEAVAAARGNCQRLEVAAQVDIIQSPLSEQPVHAGSGLVVCNPPYGKRLSPEQNLKGYYRDLGQELARAYPDWRVAMLCPDAELVKATGLLFHQMASLDNGGLSVGLFATKSGLN